jgi:bifunctional non-homologous end joining protein LigD
MSIDHAARTRPAVLFPFDVLELKGVDLRDLPMRERKKRLRNSRAPGRVRVVGEFERDGVSLSRLAAKKGIEGVIAKRADSPYRAGRSFDWMTSSDSRSTKIARSGMRNRTQRTRCQGSIAGVSVGGGDNERA